MNAGIDRPLKNARGGRSRWNGRVGQRGRGGRASVDERSGERGSATIVGVGAVFVVVALFVVAVQLGAAVVTRHRAAAAADLAALAAAAHVIGGPGQACATARRVTDRMVVRLTSCELDEWDATVRVEASPPGLLGRFGTARATARAGPAPPAPAKNDHLRRAVVRQR